MILGIQYLKMNHDPGHFEIGPDPEGRTSDHIMYSPEVKWVQDEESLLRDGLRQWKKSPTEIELHLRSVIAGDPEPNSGTGKISRARAVALLKHVREKSRPAPTLYRGASIPPEQDPSMLLGWTSDKKVAQAFAKKYKGNVYTLKDAEGIDTSNIPGVLSMGESEWIVLHKYPRADSGMEFREWLEHTGGQAIVYHVSPHPNLKKIRPETTRAESGSRLGRGVFVAPKFRDALAWADSYVKHKKPGGQYKELTIYKLQIPRDTLKTLYHASWWEPEYFVPEELADQIQIVSSKTMTNKEIVGLYRRVLAITFKERQGPPDRAKIRKLAKTNLAARLYIDLFDTLADVRMRGQDDPREPEIKDALKKLKDMVLRQNYEIFGYDETERLTPEEERVARETYARAMAPTRPRPMAYEPPIPKADPSMD